MTKRALITGASKGIGYEFARILAANQYDLVLTARSEHRFFEIKQELEEKYKIKVFVVPVDLTIPHVADEIFYELSRKDMEIDVLINNAGFGEYGKFSETDWKVERQILQLNIVTLTNLTKLYVKRMLERGGGKVLNVASVAAFQPGPLMSVFFATQAYILSFSEALAYELKDSPVTVTVLCPGPTESGFQAVAHMENTRIVKNRRLQSAQEVAEYGYRAMMAGRRIAVPGLTNKILAQSSRFLPRTILTDLVGHMHQPE